MSSTTAVHKSIRATMLAVAAVLAGGASASTDPVTSWNVTAGDAVTAAGLAAPPANRVLAIVHTAVYDAARAIASREPVAAGAAGPSLDAAVAAAAHAVLVQLLPAQRAAIDEAYRVALAGVADGAAERAGVAAGESAAAGVLARRGDDGAAAPEAYRPRVIPGVYAPTTLPLCPQWPQRKPWLMASAAEFRPGPPPRLDGEVWARDYNEVRELGARDSVRRNAAETEAARFWEATLPPIYHGLVRAVATLPGRNALDNARLFTAVTQASDDALTAVFDAKYQYAFWRPITAVRNGDLDGNDATERDPAWMPLIDTPMHPEYPCAHCIVAAAVGVVLEAELGGAGPVTLATTSPTAGGAVRTWSSVDAFVNEVAMARIAAGVHYRTSTEVGAEMGRRIGALAVARFPR